METNYLEYRGEYTSCKVFTQEIEEHAVAQIYQFLSSIAFENAQIRIMPDVHAGKGAVVGFTSTMTDKIIPNVIGVDIGCFTGDTLIPLADGKNYPIKDLVDKKLYVFSCEENGKIHVAEASAKKTRENASLVLVTLDNEKFIRCTPDHQFMTRNGEYKEAKDLEANESLMPFYSKTDNDFNNHKVVSVSELTEKEDVYCLVVPGWNNFALEAGVFVHNCGVTAVSLGDSNSNNAKVAKIKSILPEFDKYVRNNIPSGFSSREKASKRMEWLYKWYFSKGSDWDSFEKEVNAISQKVGTGDKNVWLQPGSLGGGNHFIEIGQDENGEIFLVVHSGSRNFGLKIAEFHQKKAVQNMGRKNGLEFLEKQEAEQYLRDMRVAQRFAMVSRLIMLDTMVDFFDLKIKNLELINSTHNFIGDDDIIRKGAISAKNGETVIIPWNMRDGMIIGKGKGNLDWNNSAPHGAGRLMSRSQAKKTVSMEEYKSTMAEANIWTSCVSRGTLDESPQAYKPYEDILSVIGDTVDVTNTIKPIYNFKANSED